MKVLITGANGFIGRNLSVQLREREIEVLSFTRENKPSDLLELVEKVDFIFHLAGVNRPTDPKEFYVGNADLTSQLCNALIKCEKKISVVYSSSVQAQLDNDYGKSKKKAEEKMIELSKQNGNPVYLLRLPNVFGKWARPNYNSVVATFCNNIVYEKEIHINDPASVVELVYIDDVVSCFIDIMQGEVAGLPYIDVTPKYSITVGELASTLYKFKSSRKSLTIEKVGDGLVRALYSTFLSYIPPESFSYHLPMYSDDRGAFAEVLKTTDSGQFSFFTAFPGITRGGHYHHSKTEKFLVLKGRACFRFKHIVTNQCYELNTNSERPEIVETIPGWAHDITNIGEDELVVMLWANEVFDRDNPDTITSEVK